MRPLPKAVFDTIEVRGPEAERALVALHAASLKRWTLANPHFWVEFR